MINYSIDIDGKSYLYVSSNTAGVIDQFEEWMHQFAIDNLRKLKPKLTADEYEKLWLKLGDDVETGAFVWGGEKCQKIFKTEAGQRKILHLMFSLAKPDYDRSVIDRIYSKKEDEVKPIFKQLMSAGLDPKVNGKIEGSP